MTLEESTKVVEMKDVSLETLDICGYFDLPDEESDLLVRVPAESRTPSSVRPGLVGHVEGQ